jgi:hypothetical protein
MQLDRDGLDRTGCLDREGGIGIPALLSAYIDTDSSIYARFQITHLLSSYPDTDSSIHAALLLALASYGGTESDAYARLRLDHNLAAYPDNDSSIYARFQITHLLKVSDTCSVPMYYGRNQLDRAGLDRRYTREIPCVLSGTQSSIYARLQIKHNFSSHADTESDAYARLRLDQLLKCTADTDSSIHAALLLALASYIDTDSSAYARLQITHNCAAIADTESDAYARLQISQLLRSFVDTESDAYARLQITHNMQAISDTESDIYAMLRQISSWTFTFTGTLAAGKTLCIDGRDFTVKNDGVNAIADFSGDFPSIFPGTNWVLYTDAEGSRTIQLVVSKRDRKV